MNELSRFSGMAFFTLKHGSKYTNQLASKAPKDMLRGKVQRLRPPFLTATSLECLKDPHCRHWSCWETNFDLALSGWSSWAFWNVQ